MCPVLSKSVREVAEKLQPDALLFGKDFDENIKSAKILENTGRDLIPIPSKNTKLASTRTNSKSKEGGESHLAGK